MITQEIIKNLFYYNPDTGDFMWMSPGKKRTLSKPVGNVEPNGYRAIRLKRKAYKAHRLAWLYVYGELPRCDIDHINGNRADNRICNLRKVNRRQNLSNKKSNREGKLVGATQDKHSKRWQAQITIKNKKYHIGMYDTELEAHRAYKKVVRNMSAFIMTKTQTLKGK